MKHVIDLQCEASSLAALWLWEMSVALVSTDISFIRDDIQMKLWSTYKTYMGQVFLISRDELKADCQRFERKLV